MRVAIAEDSGFFRIALVEAIEANGGEIIAACSDVDSFTDQIKDQELDIAILDICLPPTLTEDGLVLAEHLAVTRPSVGILLLSAHLGFAHVMRMLAVKKQAVGCLSKDALHSPNMLIDAVDRIDAGGTFIDPNFIEAQFRIDSLRVALTPKELEVMQGLASGLSNQGIADKMFINVKTVESAVTMIFRKLNIEGKDRNARVSAVLKFLGETPLRVS